MLSTGWTNSIWYDLLSRYFCKIYKYLQSYYETLNNLVIYLTKQCYGVLNSLIIFSLYV
jgi:hypothetical protein